jgi:hypothetical protein
VHERGTAAGGGGGGSVHNGGGARRTRRRGWGSCGGGIVGLVGLDKPACSLIVNSRFFYFVFQFANLYDRFEIYQK